MALSAAFSRPPPVRQFHSQAANPLVPCAPCPRGHWSGSRAAAATERSADVAYGSAFIGVNHACNSNTGMHMQSSRIDSRKAAVARRVSDGCSSQSPGTACWGSAARRARLLCAWLVGSTEYKRSIEFVPERIAALLVSNAKSQTMLILMISSHWLSQ